MLKEISFSKAVELISNHLQLGLEGPKIYLKSEEGYSLVSEFDLKGKIVSENGDWTYSEWLPNLYLEVKENV